MFLLGSIRKSCRSLNKNFSLQITNETKFFSLHLAIGEKKEILVIANEDLFSLQLTLKATILFSFPLYSFNKSLRTVLFQPRDC